MMNKEINTKALEINELEQELEQVSGGLHGPLEVVEAEKKAKHAEQVKSIIRYISMSY